MTPLLKAADAMAEQSAFVVKIFERDLEQGYQTRDKRFVIDMLKPFLSAYEAARREAGDELPGGMVMVPKEASQTMVDAFWRAFHKDGNPRSLWSAMVAAAKDGKDG